MRISDWSSDVCSSDLVARHEITVAEGVLAHLPAVAPTVQQRADGRAVPPGEDLAADAHGSRVYRQAPALRKRETACSRPRSPAPVEERSSVKRHSPASGLRLGSLRRVYAPQPTPVNVASSET